MFSVWEKYFSAKLSRIKNKNKRERERENEEEREREIVFLPKDQGPI